MDIKLDVPMLDYVTLTSWNHPHMGLLESTIKGIEGDGSSQKSMQYVGRSFHDGKVFVGHGEIDGKYHGMVRVSGALSDNYRWLARASDPLSGLSRIDVQMTVPCEDIDMIQVAGIMKPLARCKVGVIVSGERDGTLYLGSRKSDKLIRIYIKFLAGGDLALRFEIEYKGKRAKSVSALIPPDIRAGDMVLSGLLLGELNKVVKTGVGQFDDAIQAMKDICQKSTGGHELKARVAKLESDTMLWLETQVRQAVIRLANDHDADYDRLKQWAFNIVGDIDNGQH